MTGKPRRGTFLLVWLSLVAPVGAAEEWPFEVAQPLFTGEGIFLGNVTYVLDWGAPLPCLQVSYTCRENRILTDRGEYQNRNAANVLGLEVRCDLASRAPRAVLDPDTLRVTLDLGQAVPGQMRRGWEEPFVLKATVDCILINASRGFPRPSFLRLDIEGSDDFAHLEKTYAVPPPDREPLRKFHAR